jgi:hypothetical protein
MDYTYMYIHIYTLIGKEFGVMSLPENDAMMMTVKHVGD